MNPQRALLTLFCLLTLAAPAHAGLGSWTPSSGLDAQHARVFGTHNGAIFAGTEGDGVFSSANGAISFSPVSGGLTAPGATSIRSLDSIGGTLFAGTTAGLFKLAGSTWQPVGQAPDTAVGKRLDRAPQTLLAVGSSILAGVASGGVYRSVDAGVTWTRPAPGNGMSSSETVWGLTAHPVTANLVLAATSSGMYRSTDGGLTWTPRSDGMPWTATTYRVVVHPSAPNLYFASTSIGVYRSLDAGSSWVPISAGLTNAHTHAVFLQSANRMYAATEGGVYWSDVVNLPDPFSVRWAPITGSGLNNSVFWALADGFFPGANTLLGGTRGGAHHLTLQPADNSSKPVISTPQSLWRVGQTATASVGTWTGTLGRMYSFQWLNCPGGTNCAAIDGATDDQYVLKATDQGDQVRVRVTARGPFPQSAVSEESVNSPTIAANPADLPGELQNGAPSITAPGLPQPGHELTSDNGTQNPAPTSRTFQWMRCDGNGSNCVPIGTPGASNKYTLTDADIGHRIRVFVIGTNSAGSRSTPLSGQTNVVFPPTPVNVEPPVIVGEPHPGESLIAGAGTWASATTKFTRRWRRCDGSFCEFVSGATGPTYTVTEADLGRSFFVEVTGDPNGDGVFPGPVSVESARTAVIVPRPPEPVDPDPGAGGGGTTPGGGGGTTPGGGTVPPDTTAPAVSVFKTSIGTIERGRPVIFVIQTSEPGSITLTIQRQAPGRRKAGKCVKPTRKLRKAKKCKRWVKVGKPIVRNLGATLANISVPTSKRLKPGRYRATLVVRDAAGNKSAVERVTYRIKR